MRTPSCGSRGVPSRTTLTLMLQTARRCGLARPVAARPVRAEIPLVALGVAREVAARAVLLVLERLQDLGPGGLRAREMRIRIVHGHRLDLVERGQVARTHPAALGTRARHHHHALAEAQ